MFEISKELAEKILNYLAEKPFKEVAGMVQELSQIKPVAKPVEEAEI